MPKAASNCAVVSGASVASQAATIAMTGCATQPPQHGEGTVPEEVSYPRPVRRQADRSRSVHDEFATRIVREVQGHRQRVARWRCQARVPGDGPQLVEASEGTAPSPPPMRAPEDIFVQNPVAPPRAPTLERPSKWPSRSRGCPDVGGPTQCDALQWP